MKLLLFFEIIEMIAVFSFKLVRVFLFSRFVPCQPEHLSPEKNAERMEGAVT